MLKKLGIAVLALLLLIGLVGLFLPKSAHVERSAVIAAPACTVYAQLDDFHRFQLWSPWADKDPETQYTYSGPARGVGARMEWASEDKNVGKGSQEITAADPYRELKAHLDFGPEGTAESFFRLESEGEGTRVTWGFDTSFEGNFVGRYFGLLLDSWVGEDYEKGLAKLKALAEGLPQGDWCDRDIQIVDTQAKVIAATSGESSTVPEEIGAALGQAYGTIGSFLAQNHLEMAGAPLSISESYDEDGYRFTAGIPLAANPDLELAEDSPVTVREMPAAKAAFLVHKGPYQNLHASYEALVAYVAAHGYKTSGPSWEEYVSDPGTVPEEELITHIYMPVEG
jgi:effector-binding domain-containing protein